MWLYFCSFFRAGVKTRDQIIDAVTGPEPHLLWPPHCRYSGLLLPLPEAHVQGFNSKTLLLRLFTMNCKGIHLLVPGKQKLFTSSQEILHSYGNTASTIRVISAVFGYLDREPQCKTAGELAPDALEGRVVFQDVTFSYPSVEKATLKVRFWQPWTYCWLEVDMQTTICHFRPLIRIRYCRALFSICVQELEALIREIG